MIGGQIYSAYLGVDRSKEINEVKNSRQLNEYEVTEYNLDKIVEGLSGGNIYARWDGMRSLVEHLVIDLLLRSK